MDWLHCNYCFCQPGKPDNRKFVITNCGHLYCNQCNDGSLSTCYVCNRESQSLAIGSGMNEEMEAYFLEPEKIIRKQVDVLDFQHAQRMRFFEFLSDKLEKYNEKKKEVVTLKEEIKRHREEKNRLKDEIISKNDEIRSRNDEIRKLKMAIAQYEGNCGRSQLFKDSRHYRNNENLGSRPAPRTFGNQLQNTVSPASLEFKFKSTSEQGSSPSSNANHLFTPPQPVSFQNAYRNCESLNLSHFNVHSSSIIRSSPVSPQKIHRKVFLPGDKEFSPNKIGLQRLTLKTPSRVNSMKMAQSPSPQAVNGNILTNRYKKFL